jgi:hypothetical protein
MCLGSFALLGAGGAHLASVTALTWWLGTTQQSTRARQFSFTAVGSSGLSARSVSSLSHFPFDLAKP